MLITVKLLDEFLSKFNISHQGLSKQDKIKLVKSVINKYKIPKKYLNGLSEEEQFLRKIELVSKKRMTQSQRYKTELKTDIIARQKSIPKTGSCTKRWNNMYKSISSNKEKSKVTGIPKHILDKVENKGVGAFYSSGSRPGQTGNSWGKARVNCFILNKPSVTQGPDKHLYLEALKSPRAKKWFKKIDGLFNK